MDLKLTGGRPVVFIKTKTTGLDSGKDRILELSLIKFTEGKEPISITRRFNPGVDISKESSDISGIRNEDVVNEVSFEKKAKGISSFLKGCDFVGFNIRRFDIPFIVSEMYRSGITFNTFNCNFIDLFDLYSKMNPNNFVNAIMDYCGRDISNVDLDSKSFLVESVELFNKMVQEVVGKTYNDNFITEDFGVFSEAFDPMFGALDVDGKIVLNENGRPVFSFGKHKGKVVADVLTIEDKSYYTWLVNGNFSFDTKEVVKRIFKKAKSKVID